MSKPRQISDSEKSTALKEIEYFGYAVVKNYVGRDTVEEALERVCKYWASQQKAGLKNISANQAQDRVVYHLQFKDKYFLDLLTESNVLDLVKPFLNDPYYRRIPDNEANFLLAYFTARSSVVDLPLHIDNYIPFRGRYPIAMQAVISLNGQKRENGATTVVPGSHLLGDFADRDFQSAKVIECDAGDLVVWDSRLWHGALENPTKQDRWSLIATFRPWWAKQNYDPVRGFSEQLYAQLTNQQKALVGFLSLPPVDETEKVALKEGYEDLLGSLKEYRERRAVG